MPTTPQTPKTTVLFASTSLMGSQKVRAWKQKFLSLLRPKTRHGFAIKIDDGGTVLHVLRCVVASKMAKVPEHADARERPGPMTHKRQ